MATTTFNDTVIPSPAIIEAETYEPSTVKAVSLTDPRSAAAEQYRVLRYRLECLQKSGIKALAFTSPQSGDGKTTTAVNAALALGRGGRNRVVLVDADLRRPTVHQMLGLRAREGLCDVIAGRANLAGCLWRFGQDELYVLPAGNVPDDFTESLYNPRMATVMQELKDRFDFVVVDTPPVLPLADVPTLCRDLDGAIMVVRAGKTSSDMIGSAIDALYGIPVHGMVLNEVDPAVTVALSLLYRDARYDTPKALPPAMSRTA